MGLSISKRGSGSIKEVFMTLIKKLRVILDKYNFDPVNPTIWPTANFEFTVRGYSTNYSRAEEFLKEHVPHVQYALNPGVLPRGTSLEFSNATNIYAVIGKNGIGKTTFLKSIAQSLENAMWFEVNKRTKLFGGLVGGYREYYPKLSQCDILPSSGGRLRIWENYSGVSIFYGFKKRAYETYMLFDEIFNSPNFQPYKNLTMEEAINRIIHPMLIPHMSNKEHMAKVKQSESEIFKSFCQDISSNLQLEPVEVYRKAVYLSELCANIAQIPYPINIFGGYEMELSAKAQDITLDIVDLALNTDDKLSKGQYVAGELEAALKTLTPAIMLIDEPTGNMDMKNCQWVYDEFIPKVTSMENAQAFIATNDSKLVDKIQEKGGKVIDMYERPTIIR